MVFSMQPLNVCVIDDLEDFLSHFEEMASEIPEINMVGKFLSAKQALDTLPQLSINTAIVDIRMPEMDGFSLARLLLEQNPSTKVILVSDQKNPRYYNLAKQVGAQTFIPKEDLSKETLLEALSQG